MTDEKTIPQRLRGLHDELVEHGCFNLELIEEAACEIERLTPKPLMTHEIVDALNASGFLGATDWSCDIDDEIDRPYFTPALGLRVRLELGEAQIVAQGLLRDKEADRWPASR